MREIKFRAWHVQHQKMFEHKDIPVLLKNVRDDSTWKFMQYTGRKDKNWKEIYEGDIFRIEEETDIDDRILYVVITWVEEWCMFATLSVQDEYLAYLSSGIDALDEPLFWTYTLEDTNSRKHFLCGNIYETPHLLKS